MAEFVARGKAAYDADLALRRAVERTAENVGEVVKRMLTLDPTRFHDPQWRQAARFRDMLAHHDEQIDADLVWRIAAVRMPALQVLLSVMSPARSPDVTGSE